MADFDEVMDFVIVGSGGGSMCAGLLMRSIGKEVAILEKTNLIGGTTSPLGRRHVDSDQSFHGA